MWFEKTILNTLKLHYQWILIGIVALATFIRIYNLEQWMPFISDQGRDFLAAREILTDNKVPLLGIPSSVPRFKQGPLYVWFTAFGLLLGQGNPVIVGYLAALIGVLSIVVTITLANKYFGKTTAIVSGILLTFSPLAIQQSRLAFHTNPIPLVSAVFILVLYRWLEQPKFNLFWVGLVFAMLFQFELVVAPLFLIILLIWWWQRKKTTKLQITKLILGLLLGLLPQILYDLTHNFEQLGTFIVWIGYRIAGFMGIFSEHQASSGKLIHVLQTSFGYAQRFFSWPNPLPTVVWLVVTSLLLVFKRDLPKNVVLLIAWMGVMFVSFIVLGNASEAYFPVLFIPAALLTGYGIASLSETYYKVIAVLVLLIVGLLNLRFLVRAHYLISDDSVTVTNPFSTYGPSITEQLQAVDFISDRFDQYTLESTDENAVFESYLDNYRYLLLWKGKSETEGAQAIIINHNPNSPGQGLKYEFGTVTVIVPIRL